MCQNTYSSVGIDVIGATVVKGRSSVPYILLNAFPGHGGDGGIDLLNPIVRGQLLAAFEEFPDTGGTAFG